MVVSIDAEVGTCNDVPNLEEVEALEADWDHLFYVITDVAKFVKALALLIDFDPSVVFYISQYLIFSLKTKLLWAEFSTCLRT